VTADKLQFEQLVGPHFDALYRAAFRLTRSHADAEDLLQDVCLRAFTNLTELAGTDRPLSWLLSVQYRRFIDLYRRRSRQALLGSDALPADELPAPGPAVDEVVAALNAGRHLDHAWSQLKHEQRALLAMHAEGYGLAELAEITGASKNALSVRLHRARTRLAELLSVGEAASLVTNH
jgi:RNA polymerase sigma-70 factor (ECF subfamily)